MKVSKGEEAFIPIHIVIETKEEARLLWDILNCPIGQSINAYYKDAGYMTGAGGFEAHTLQDMFETFNEVFYP